MFCLFFFFFKQKTAYEMRISDWSSDVCSSDLVPGRKNSELRLGAILENRDFDSEIAIFEQFAAIRALGVFFAFALGVALTLCMFVFAFGSAAAGSERDGKEQRRCSGGKWKLLHGIFSARGAESKNGRAHCRDRGGH